ncbi:MAG TPA: dephospho-CoA kinase [Jatrophihabitans sp.]|uniref:dephospho-CoA kinase n=1 Tax=Jatrophihabitans sp. TaxID=1932789 RepID=UPI002F1DA8FF
MLRIGLTGGIGSGKSTVAARLAELGAVVIDSDLLAREVVSVDSPGLARVVERFGPAVLAADGTLDRPGLGRLVFGDPAALADLNAIVHPLVRARSEALTAEAAAAGAVAVVHDIPLLVENKLAAGYDAVIVVETPLELRLRRLAGRGLDAETARARIAAQATDEERRAVADIVLDNSGTVAELTAQVDAAWARLVGGRSGGG